VGHIKNENFYVIQGWMMNELKLKGNDLGTYAIIYGFTQAKYASYSGSLSYLAEFLNVDKRTIQNVLKRLVQKKLIQKHELQIDGMKRCVYVAIPTLHQEDKQKYQKNTQEHSEDTQEENASISTIQKDKQNTKQAENVITLPEYERNRKNKEKISIPNVEGEKFSIPRMVGEKNFILNVVVEEQESTIFTMNDIKQVGESMEKNSIPDIVVGNNENTILAKPKAKQCIQTIMESENLSHPITINRNSASSPTKNFHGGMEKFSTNNIKDIKRDSININIYQSIKEILKENIDYTTLQHDRTRQDERLIDEVLAVMLDAYCSKKDSLVLNSVRIPIAVVQAQMMKITKSHIEYVLHCLAENTTKIHNIRAYLLTAIYNAPNTIHTYYKARVQYDLYGQKEEGG
jgi:Sugar-specific transcriptional regulator TrmB.